MIALRWAMSNFWQDKELKELTADQWEALCDGCALCCLHKLEDEDTGLVYYTQVGCRLLDCDTCRCKDYANRTAQIPECRPLEIDAELMGILPKTCAYRLRFEGKALPEWHYLVCGDRDEVHRLGISVKGKAFDEDMVDMDDLEEYIIHQIE